MSYCVNCGVKLEQSLEACPLCNTPIINPNELGQIKTLKPPFPKESGQVEVVKRKDLAILLSVVLGATALSCGLLNLLVFKQNTWSLLIIGLCILLWIFAVPFVIYTRLSAYTSLFLDGIAVGIYLFMISFITPSRTWLWEIALPITAIVTILAIIIVIFYRHVSSSFLGIALCVFVQIAFLCVSIELLIRHYFNTAIALTWSAVVLTACTIIAITLITILSKKRLRNEVRRRLHF